MKRTKGQIIFKILLTCRIGQIKTRIANICGLDQYALERYLDMLIENRLIKVYNFRPDLYKTTDRGFEALEHLRTINELMPEWFK